MASVTSINGVLNGTSGTYNLGIDQNKHSFTKEDTEFSSKFVPELIKYFSIFQNHLDYQTLFKIL